MMNRKTLLANGIAKLLSGVFLMGLLLFLPAGTWDYPGAWRMVGLMALSMVLMGGILLFAAPSILEKRLSSKEKEKEQGVVIALSGLMFVASFLLCGFDRRFGWTTVPLWLVVLSTIVFILTYLGFGELLRENEFLSRTVEVQENQKVVSTGLYGIVRHPMYFIITFMFFSMPLVIGSFAGILPLLFLPMILVKRIRNEEKVLEEGLEGYKEYKEKVRYRLVPFVW